MTRRRAQIAVVALAIALSLVPLPPLAVEKLFSNGLYPTLQSALTRLSNLVPFALFDVFLVIVIGWWGWRLGRDVSMRRANPRGWIRVLARVVSRTIVLAAALYLGFLFTWGLNYRRPPLTDRLATNPQGLTADGSLELVLTAVTELNALYSEAHLDGVPIIGAPLVDAFARTQALIGVGTPARPARPKRTLLDWYFMSAGVAGMTDPFFLETMVASDLLPVERPFVVAHEWSHLAGFVDEGEANFVGWLTCVRGAAIDRYSGWLFLYSEALPGLPRQMRAQASAGLAAGPRDDLRAIADRVRRHVRPRISNAGWTVYDRYLKANRVEAGAASYREVVRLVLGTRFDPQWTPVLK